MRGPYAGAAPAMGLARLSDTLREVRRISHALRPSMLDDLGLAAALDQLARELKEETGIELQCERVIHDATPALPDSINTALFRIAQEALTNVVRHAAARRVTLKLEVAPKSVVLSIRDDGRGFDVERMQADARSGIGLRNMRERLDAIGGTLSLTSEPGNTIVTAMVPLRRPPASAQT